jgi:hypothetical protein
MVVTFKAITKTATILTDTTFLDITDKATTAMVLISTENATLNRITSEYYVHLKTSLNRIR